VEHGTHVIAREPADRAVALSGAAVAAAAVAGKAAGLAEFIDYPLTYAASAPADVAFAVALALIAVAGPLAAAARGRKRGAVA